MRKEKGKGEPFSLLFAITCADGLLNLFGPGFRWELGHLAPIHRGEFAVGLVEKLYWAYREIGPGQQVTQVELRELAGVAQSLDFQAEPEHDSLDIDVDVTSPIALDRAQKLIRCPDAALTLRLDLEEQALFVCRAGDLRDIEARLDLRMPEELAREVFRTAPAIGYALGTEPSLYRRVFVSPWPKVNACLLAREPVQALRQQAGQDILAGCWLETAEQTQAEANCLSRDTLRPHERADRNGVLYRSIHFGADSPMELLVGQRKVKGKDQLYLPGLHKPNGRDGSYNESWAEDCIVPMLRQAEAGGALERLALLARIQTLLPTLELLRLVHVLKVSWMFTDALLAGYLEQTVDRLAQPKEAAIVPGLTVTGEDLERAIGESKKPEGRLVNPTCREELLLVQTSDEAWQVIRYADMWQKVEDILRDAHTLDGLASELGTAYRTVIPNLQEVILLRQGETVLHRGRAVLGGTVEKASIVDDAGRELADGRMLAEGRAYAFLTDKEQALHLPELVGRRALNVTLLLRAAPYMDDDVAEAAAKARHNPAVRSRLEALTVPQDWASTLARFRDGRIGISCGPCLEEETGDQAKERLYREAAMEEADSALALLDS